MRKTIEERFRKKYKWSLTGCWLWQGRCVKGGYGQFDIADKNIYAHRLSWELHFGPIPEGMDVLHHCDTPPCVRPSHLFLGTDIDNKKDCMTKERHCYGEQHYEAKLTDAIVKEAKYLHFSKGQSKASLARKYGVSAVTMGHAIRGDTWRHV